MPGYSLNIHSLIHTHILAFFYDTEQSKILQSSRKSVILRFSLQPFSICVTFVFSLKPKTLGLFILNHKLHQLIKINPNSAAILSICANNDADFWKFSQVFVNIKA